MVKETVYLASLHELCAVACEALDALEVGGHPQEELKTRFHLVLEQLGPKWCVNFAEID